MSTTRVTTDDLDQACQRMMESWPSEFIARSEIERFTGGLMSYKTQANLDAVGKGPGRIKRGRLTGYIKEPYVKWLRGQLAVGGR